MIEINRKKILLLCLSPIVALVLFIFAYILTRSTFPQIFGYPESWFDYIITIDSRVFFAAVLFISVITIGGTFGVMGMLYQRIKKKLITEF